MKWDKLLMIGGLGLLAWYIFKDKFASLGGGGGGSTWIEQGTVITPEPIPQPINTTINAYNLLPEENRLRVPDSTFNWAPYTESGNLTVFPLVTESLVDKGVAQKYVPITQLVTPQAQMLQTLTQKLTPAVTYNTGAGVRLPDAITGNTLFNTLNTPKVVQDLVTKITPAPTPMTSTTWTKADTTLNMTYLPPEVYKLVNTPLTREAPVVAVAPVVNSPFANIQKQGAVGTGSPIATGSTLTVKEVASHLHTNEQQKVISLLPVKTQALLNKLDYVLARGGVG